MLLLERKYFTGFSAFHSVLYQGFSGIWRNGLLNCKLFWFPIRFSPYIFYEPSYIPALSRFETFGGYVWNIRPLCFKHRGLGVETCLCGFFPGNVWNNSFCVEISQYPMDLFIPLDRWHQLIFANILLLETKEFVPLHHSADENERYVCRRTYYY